MLDNHPRGFSLIETMMVLIISGLVMAAIFASMADRAKTEKSWSAAVMTAEDAAQFARAVREYDYYTTRGNKSSIRLKDLQDAGLYPNRGEGLIEEELLADGRELEASIYSEDGVDLVLVYPAGRMDEDRMRKFDMDNSKPRQTIFMSRVAQVLNDRFAAPNTVAGVVEPGERVARGPYGSFNMDLGAYMDRRNDPYWVIIMTLPKD